MSLFETAELLGNFGEFLGALAVVATLIYLAVQVRYSRQALDANTDALNENRRLARAQAYQIRSQMAQDYFVKVAESNHIAVIAAKISAEGWESLSSEERLRYETSQRANLARIDNLHYQHSLGYLDEELYEETMRNAAPLVRFWRYLGILQGRKRLIEDLLATLPPQEEKGSSDIASR